jgi:hypothetical protein
MKTLAVATLAALLPRVIAVTPLGALLIPN